MPASTGSLGSSHAKSEHGALRVHTGSRARPPQIREYTEKTSFLILSVGFEESLSGMEVGHEGADRRLGEGGGS